LTLDARQIDSEYRGNLEGPLADARHLKNCSKQFGRGKSITFYSAFRRLPIKSIQQLHVNAHHVNGIYIINDVKCADGGNRQFRRGSIFCNSFYRRGGGRARWTDDNDSVLLKNIKHPRSGGRASVRIVGVEFARVRKSHRRVAADPRELAGGNRDSAHARANLRPIPSSTRELPRGSSERESERLDKYIRYRNPPYTVRS